MVLTRTFDTKKSTDPLSLFGSVAHWGGAPFIIGCFRTVRPPGGHDRGERLLEAWCGFGLVPDEHHLEQCLVEEPAVAVLDTAIEPVHLAEQSNGAVEEAQHAAHLPTRLFEALLEPAAFEPDLVHPVADLAPLEDALSGEVDQVRLLAPQPRELLRDGLAQTQVILVLMLKRAMDAGAQPRNPLVLEPCGRVHRLDSLLGLVKRNVRSVAGALLPAAAEEVEVLVTPARGAGDDHPVTSALTGTPAAKERAAEVVRVHAAPLVGGRARLQDSLDAGEELRRDERLVAPYVALAVVGDEAEVVRVA